MRKKRFQPEEIVGNLRHADVLLGQGKKATEVVKALGVTDGTYYRWRQEYRGMTIAHANRLKALERENGRLRKPAGWTQCQAMGPRSIRRIHQLSSASGRVGLQASPRAADGLIVARPRKASPYQLS